MGLFASQCRNLHQAINGCHSSARLLRRHLHLDSTGWKGRNTGSITRQWKHHKGWISLPTCMKTGLMDLVRSTGICLNQRCRKCRSIKESTVHYKFLTPWVSFPNQIYRLQSKDWLQKEFCIRLSLQSNSHLIVYWGYQKCRCRNKAPKFYPAHSIKEYTCRCTSVG